MKSSAFLVSGLSRYTHLRLPHWLSVVSLEVSRKSVIWYVFLHHVEILRSLEGVSDRDDVGVIAGAETLKFAARVKLPTARSRGKNLVKHHAVENS